MATRKISITGTSALTGLVLIAAAIIVGCGGNAGVDNGTIVGQVFSNFSNGVAGRVPEPGVSIVAQRETDPPQVIRNTVSDANGQFVLSNMPTGSYLIGYAKDGFDTISTNEGATAQRTAIGNQIRVFVEPGAVATAPDVTLRKLAEVGNATVIITLLDFNTGQPVNNATVTVGTATTSNGGNNGVYTLQVPVNVDNPGGVFGQPSPARVLVNADGFTPSNDQFVTPITDQTTRLTLQLQPETAIIQGIIQISAFDQLYLKSNITVRISSSNNTALVAPVAQDGTFAVNVPRSTSSLTRQFNLVFTHPGLQPFTLSNVVAPVGGARTLSQTIVMNPKVVTLVGQVVDSFGNAPNNLGPVADTATVNETGQQSTIINGTYTIPGVPTGTDNGLATGGITITVKVFNPARINNGPPPRNGVEETFTTNKIIPLVDTIFTVPLITTS